MKKTLVLTKKEVESLITMKETLPTVEEAFRYHGRNKVEMPAKTYIHLKKYCGDFRAMPAYIEGMEASGLKWVNVHPGNSRFGLPAVMAVIIYSDPRTGFPLCIMDGTAITNFRTGAAGGIAAKYLARRNSRRVALVGCGAQGRSQLGALNELFNVGEVKIWGREGACAEKFCREMKNPRFSIRITRSVEECVKDADIIVTTTPSRRPIVRSEWIKKGAHINAIGADAKGKEELDPKLLSCSKVVIDDWSQASHSGEINVPLEKGMISKRDIYASLGEIVAGKKPGRKNDEEITIFDSTGLAVQDIAVARLVYKKALGRLTKGLSAGRFVGII